MFPWIFPTPYSAGIQHQARLETSGGKNSVLVIVLHTRANREAIIAGSQKLHGRRNFELMAREQDESVGCLSAATFLQNREVDVRHNRCDCLQDEHIVSS